MLEGSVYIRRNEYIRKEMKGILQNIFLEKLSLTRYELLQSLWTSILDHVPHEEESKHQQALW